jgi:hypothetical protein
MVGFTPKNQCFLTAQLWSPELSAFIINSCVIKHKGIYGNVNLIILVRVVNGQGPNGAINTLAL